MDSLPRSKLFAFLTVAGVAAILFIQFGHLLSLSFLAQRETQLRQVQIESPIVVFGIACLAYVAVTGLSLPGAAVLTLLFGWYFGFVQGLILVSFASTAGASIAFLLSRFLFRESMEKRFGPRLASFNRSLADQGAFYLFSLRLIPAIPFFVINAIMGLTPMKLRTFWWVSQLGMLPGTAVYIYAGSSVPSLQRLANEGVKAVFSPAQLTQILAALIALGMLPWVMRFPTKAGKTKETKLEPSNPEEAIGTKNHG